VGTSTGRSALRLRRSSPYTVLKESLETHVTQKSQEVVMPGVMSGKKKPGLKEPSLNLEPCPSTEPRQTTGNGSGDLPYPGILSRWKPRLEFVIIGVSELLRQTIVNQVEWSEQLLCCGVQLEQESLVGLGLKPDWTLTLKIRCPNSGKITLTLGVDIEIRKMLLSMNFAEESRSVMYYGGSIDILSTWKSKDLVCLSLPKRFGSLRTCTLQTGTPI